MARPKSKKETRGTEEVAPVKEEERFEFVGPVTGPNVFQRAKNPTLEIRGNETIGGIDPPVESTSTTSTGHRISKRNIMDGKIVECLERTISEIHRCEDYICAHADVDRIFATYKEELHTYRYNLRQLTLDVRYPDIPDECFPVAPTCIEDR